MQAYLKAAREELDSGQDHYDKVNLSGETQKLPQLAHTTVLPKQKSLLWKAISGHGFLEKQTVKKIIKSFI